MHSIWNTAQDLLGKLLSFAMTIIEALTEPFGQVWGEITEILPVWAEILLTPAVWLIDTILPQGASILDMVMMYGIPLIICWGIVNFFTQD